MSGKSITHNRVMLLKAFLDKNLSENTVMEILRIIKAARKSGENSVEVEDRAAEAKAEELTQLINESKTEAEILEKIKEMQEAQ